MTTPTYRVEVAFNAGASTAAAARTWTDITSYALISEGIDTTYARGDRRSVADSNSLRLTLNNSDGRFTAGLASSPYYPNVKIGRPIRVSTNFIPNPDFESNATGWTGSNCTLSRTISQAHSGVASLSMTASTAATMIAVTSGSGTGGIPVAGSTKYLVEAWFRAATVSRLCQVRVDWYDSVGTFISTSTGTSVSNSTSAWTFVDEEYTSPATAVYARFQALVINPASSEVHYIDDVFLGAARFTGFVDEWPLDWPATIGTFATATVTARSRLASLGTGAEFASIVEEEVLLDGPAAYYTLGESAGATFASDSSGNNAPALRSEGSGAAVVFGSATGPGTDGLTAATFAAGKYLTSIPLAMANQNVTLIAAINVTSAPGSGIAPLVGLPQTGGGGLWIAPTTGGILNLGGWRPPTGGALSGVGVAGSYTVNQTTVVAVTVNSSGSTVSTYQDGVLLGTDGWNPPQVTDTLGRFNVGFQPITGTSTTIVQPNAVVAHAMVFSTELTAGQIADISDSMLNGFAGETPAERITRYASYAGIPSTELNLETGMVPDLAHIDTTGRTALDCMRAVEATEEGVLFDGKDGNLTFHARNHRYSAASAFTLDVASGQVAVSPTSRLDRTGIRNDVSATSTDGTITARVFDQTSIDDYGPARESLDLATTNWDEPGRHAYWLVGTYAQPTSRVPQLVVDIKAIAATLAAEVLAAEVGTRFTVTNMPSQAPNSSQDYFVEGWSESITAARHMISFNVSEAEPFKVWILGDSTYGVLGSTTRLAF